MVALPNSRLGKQHQSRIGNPFKQIDPRGKRARVHFAIIVQATKRDLAAGQRRQWVDLRLLGFRRKTPEAVGKANGFFCIDRIVLPRRLPDSTKLVAG